MVVIGVAAYFLSQPKEGTIEWHKREYLKTLERLSHNTWKHKVQRVYCRVARRPFFQSDLETYRSDIRTFEGHQASLVRLGYLQEARVSLTNAFGTNGVDASAVRYLGRDEDEALRRFTIIRTNGLKVVHITAPPSVLPIVEAAVRKADVPPSK